MIQKKKWKLLSEKQEGEEIDAIIKLLLTNRGLTDTQAIEKFLHPDIADVTVESVGIDPKQVTKTIKRLEKALLEKEKIVVYGDYDVDGITGTAILWETLHAIGFTVMPYIPNRMDEGYGLSTKGIENIVATHPGTKMIITVDNGIVAHESVAFAKSKGIEVVITDHHLPAATFPDAFAIIHTTQLCGAGVGWIFAQELLKKYPGDYFFQQKEYDHLSLVALATVADLVPLTSANRIVLSIGLQQLCETKRPGLLALLDSAKIQTKDCDVYTIGHIIAPRINAMGRLESAMDSLRLLCTKDKNRAKELAAVLDITNKNRQFLTQTAGETARLAVLSVKEKKKLLFLYSENYEEGIIGLVAGKLVETFYRPAIVISQGTAISKGSARSVAGFNIIEFIRKAEHLLINAGGHPMAAGFTVATENLGKLEEMFASLAGELILEEMLIRQLVVDVRLPLAILGKKLLSAIKQLAPFGNGNPEPIFASEVMIKSISAIGKEKQHLKLKVTQDRLPFALDAIAFGMGELAQELEVGNTIDIAYTLDENTWNGKTTLQLKIKDIQYEQQR